MKKLNVNTNGNKKLVNNERVRFMIWNLPAVETCPFRTGLCEASCYARKAERVYPQVLPARQANYQETLSPDFVENMIYTIEKLLNSKAYAGKLAVFRIHESGDFYSLAYAKKWVDIAYHFKNDSRIIFTAYSKSLPFIIESGYASDWWPRNLIIRASKWEDTAPEMVDLINRYNFPVYTALPADELETAEHVHKCRCADCAGCLNCYTNTLKLIACAIH